LAECSAIPDNRIPFHRRPPHQRSHGGSNGRSDLARSDPSGDAQRHAQQYWRHTEPPERSLRELLGDGLAFALGMGLDHSAGPEHDRQSRHHSDRSPRSADIKLMAYWLIKSEPDTWSWDQHVKKGADSWTGVRNHQAKVHLQTMKKGDKA